MITLNNKKFAESEKEFTESLFTSGGTCSGYAKKYKRHIKIYDVTYTLIAEINRYGCICKANLQSDGSIWYNYGDTMINNGGYKFTDRETDISNIAISKEYKSNEIVYCFK